MANDENELLTRARKTLANILGSIPDAKLTWDIQRSTQRDLAGLADIVVGVNTHSHGHALVVEFKNPGHPRQLDQAISQLLRYRHHAKSALDYLVVAAPFITAEGAALC